MRLDDRWYAMAWIEIWHELPDLFGGGWRDAFPWVMEIMEALRTSSAQEERRQLIRRLKFLVRSHEGVRDRLRQLADFHRRERTDVDPCPAAPSWESLQEGWSSCVNPAVVERRLEIRAPRRLAVGSTAEVQVALPAAEPAAESRKDTVQIQARSKIAIFLRGTPGLLEVLSGDRRETRLENPFEDPLPVRFAIHGIASGHGRLVVDVRQERLLLGSFSVPLEVIEGATDALEAATAGHLSTGGRPRLPADLDFRVLHWRRNGQDLLEFDLSSWNNASQLFHREVLAPSPKRHYGEYQQGLIERMDALRADPQDLLSLQRLEAEGCQLFRQLFPVELQEAYRTLDSSIQSLQIISDEPWIPWELVRCCRAGADQAEFLCERFSCARWLSGTNNWVEEIRVHDFACVAAREAPGRTPLSYPESDKALLQSLAADLELRNRSPEPATAEALLRLHASREVDLWHIAAPELPFPHDPGEMGILLSGGRHFTANDLAPGQRTDAARRPLVFMNVSQSARLGWGLTRLAGWASAWATDGRCGAFIAPLFNVSDELAHLFAGSFYEALREGATLAKAMARARLRVRAEAPGDPTWIAYQLYASPNTRVRWEAASRGAE